MQIKVFCLTLVLSILCPGTGMLFAQIKVTHNSSSANPQLLLTENASDQARISFQNTNQVNQRWVQGGLVGNSSGSSYMNFRFEGAQGASNRFTILGNGQVGINNFSPDEALVVGTNFGTNWTVPAITVGSASGGALQVGRTGSYNLSIESTNDVLGPKLISRSSLGVSVLRIEASGVGIGANNTDSEGYALRVMPTNLGVAITSQNGAEDWELFSTSFGSFQLYRNNELRGSFDGTTGAYVEISDQRLKRGIKNLEGVLDRLMDLQVKRYTYKSAAKGGRESIGLIAQDIEPLFPEVVYQQQGKRNKGTYGINYSGLGPIAIKAIQELKLELDEKTAAVEQLEAAMQDKDQQIESLRDRLDRIEKLLDEGRISQNTLVLDGASGERKKAALQQNVPNPFRSLTAINYRVPEDAQSVQLKISDQTGKVIRTMEIGQRGQINTTLDASALSAGTYFYSLWVDGQMIDTKKMVQY